MDDTNPHHHRRHRRRKIHGGVPEASEAAVRDRDVRRYTSLRDLPELDPNSSINGSVKKHASSAYLRSSPALPGGGSDRSRRSCFASFRRNTAALCFCWRVYVSDPIMACFRPLLRFFSLVTW